LGKYRAVNVLPANSLTLEQACKLKTILACTALVSLVTIGWTLIKDKQVLGNRQKDFAERLHRLTEPPRLHQAP
jgi:hypothetical protein